MPDKNSISFEIKEHLGVIAEFDSGWTRELNIISWNGGTAKYDLRDWDPYHERMSKGLTFFESDLRKLIDLFLHNNSQKAVERGRELEAGRKQRQLEQIKNSRKESSEEATNKETMESALPPEPEEPEGAELVEVEEELESSLESAEEMGN